MATTAIWGGTFVVVKGALADASPLPFLAVRFALAGVLLLAILGRGRVERGAILPGFILGLFLFVGYFFQTYGLIYTTPSKSAFLTGFSVILVPVIVMLSASSGALMNRWERRHGAQSGECRSLRGRLGGLVAAMIRAGPKTPRGISGEAADPVSSQQPASIGPANLVGALLGLGGIYLLVAPSGMSGVNRGDLLTLAGACSFAIHIVLVGHYTKKVSFLHLVPAQILVVALLSWLALPLAPERSFHLTARLVMAILITALLATGVAFSVQNWAQQYTPAAPTALIFALEPVFAALASWLALGERFGTRALAGSGLILAGMVVSEIWGGGQPSPVEG